MTEVVITAAKRTPVGAFLGAFAGTPAHELGRVAIEAALAQAGVAPEDVSEVILGQVLQAGSGMNVARQLALRLGLSQSVTGFTVNMVCASGMKAVALAADAIASGQSSVVLAGGVESMSNIEHYTTTARWGSRSGNQVLYDRLDRGRERHDLRIHRQLAQTASDQLGVLGAKVQDEDGLMRHDM